MKTSPSRVSFGNIHLVARARALTRGGARDVLLTMAANASIAICTAIGGILAARLLGPEGRGQLAAAVAWAGILGGVAQLGLPQALTYATAKRPDEISTIFSTTAILCLVQSGGAVSAGWLAAKILDPTRPDTADLVRVYLLSIPFSLSLVYLSVMAQGLQRFWLFSGLRLGSASGYPIALVVARALQMQDARPVIALLIGWQVVTAIVAIVVFSSRIKPSGRFGRDYARKLVKYGLRAHVGNLSWMANVRLDQFVMSAIVGLDELGNYAVAVSYSSVLLPLSSALAMVLFPSVARADVQTAKARIARALKLNLLLSGLGGLGMIVLSPALLPWLFGQSFRPAVSTSMILTVGTIVLGCNHILSDGLRGLGLPGAVSLAEVFGLGATLVGLLLLLPWLGIRGAAFVSLISYSIVCCALTIKFRHHSLGLSISSKDLEQHQSE